MGAMQRARILPQPIPTIPRQLGISWVRDHFTQGAGHVYHLVCRWSWWRRRGARRSRRRWWKRHSISLTISGTSHLPAAWSWQCEHFEFFLIPTLIGFLVTPGFPNTFASSLQSCCAWVSGVPIVCLWSLGAMIQALWIQMMFYKLNRTWLWIYAMMDVTKTG